MASLPRYVAGDWLQVVRVVVIAFVKSASSRCTSLAAGFLLAGNGSSLTSIQWLKRLRPAWFRQDLIALFDLLEQRHIKPLIAQRFPLAEARHAHELLGKGGVTGKIVLVHNGSSLESGAA
jgi:NADPH:quinone reductase-like Zn-dependent oxidoreductase